MGVSVGRPPHQHGNLDSSSNKRTRQQTAGGKVAKDGKTAKRPSEKNHRRQQIKGMRQETANSEEYAIFTAMRKGGDLSLLIPEDDTEVEDETPSSRCYNWKLGLLLLIACA